MTNTNVKVLTSKEGIFQKGDLASTLRTILPVIGLS